MEVVFYIFIFSEVIIHAKHMLLFYYLHQWFPTFSAPGIGGRQLWKTIFSTSLGGGGGGGYGMSQVHYACCALYFYYYYISSTSDH